MYKISVHIVYKIVVNEDRAATLRQHCIEVLNDLSQGPHSEGDSIVIRVQQQLLALGDMNTWKIVFDSSVTVGSNGLRVPLNDKRDRSKADVRLPLENRLIVVASPGRGLTFGRYVASTKRIRLF